jgi:hypothetical protein
MNNDYTQSRTGGPLIVRPDPQERPLEVRIRLEYDTTYLRDKMVADVYAFGLPTGAYVATALEDVDRLDLVTHANWATHPMLAQIASEMSERAMRLYVEKKPQEIVRLQEEVQALKHLVFLLTDDAAADRIPKRDRKAINRELAGYVATPLSTKILIALGAIAFVVACVFLGRMHDASAERAEHQRHEQFVSDCSNADGRVVTFDDVEKCVVDGGVVQEYGP